MAIKVRARNSSFPPLLFYPAELKKENEGKGKATTAAGISNPIEPFYNAYILRRWTVTSFYLSYCGFLIFCNRDLCKANITGTRVNELVITTEVPTN
jgi:hypothetical protein